LKNLIVKRLSYVALLTEVTRQ